jgi:hypothetical protein
MFASNNVNVRLGDENTIDRALFYTKAYTADFMGLTQIEFNEWTLRQKPFFDEFGEFLKRADVKAHYMQLFNQIKVDRHQVENIKWSSSRDPDILIHNISGPRKIAKVIIESGRLFPDLDISTPFTTDDFHRQVTELVRQMNENVRSDWVLEEFKQLNLLERVRVGNMTKFRFKWSIGTLTQKFGDAIGIPIEPQFEFGPGDFGENANVGEKPVQWKGVKRHKF